MDYSKFSLCFFLIFSSWVYVGFSQKTRGDAGNGGPGPQMECVQKLLPCEPYLHSSSPPPTCCLPLKEMVVNETQCLCGVITNPEILKSLNVTKDDAITLAKNCGANPDLSLCKNGNYNFFLFLSCFCLLEFGYFFSLFNNSLYSLIVENQGMHGLELSLEFIMRLEIGFCQLIILFLTIIDFSFFFFSDGLKMPF